MQGIKGCRQIFSRARKANCDSLVFVSAAMQEYYITKDKAIAFKIFQVGLKRFVGDFDFLLRYMELLIASNEDQSKIIHL
jgi:cleavage stimulation factor subunit 3